MFDEKNWRGHISRAVTWVRKSQSKTFEVSMDWKSDEILRLMHQVNTTELIVLSLGN